MKNLKKHLYKQKYIETPGIVQKKQGNNTHTSRKLKIDRKNNKRHEKQNLPVKVSLTVSKVPQCLGNSRDPRWNVKNYL